MSINSSNKAFKPNRQPILLVVAAASILVTLLSGDAFYPQPTRADSVTCVPDWYNSTDPLVLNYCGDQKARQSAQRQQADYQRKLTEPYYQTIPGSAPTTMLPQPPETKVIKKLPRWWEQADPDFADGGGPTKIRNAKSVWQAGSVPNAAYLSWDPLWIYSTPGNGAVIYERGTSATRINNDNPTLSTIVINGDDSQIRFALDFTCPQPLGKLTITGVGATSTLGLGADPPHYDGLNYIVYFTSPSGVTGNFNMAKLQWQFSNQLYPIPAYEKVCRDTIHCPDPLP